MSDGVFCCLTIQIWPSLLLSVLEPSGLKHICYSTEVNKRSLNRSVEVGKGGGIEPGGWTGGRAKLHSAGISVDGQ